MACCRNLVCGSCVARWKEMSNACPLCKASFQEAAVALTEALEALEIQSNSVANTLQKITSLTAHMEQEDPRAFNIRRQMNDIFDSAMKAGLFGHIPNTTTHTFSLESNLANPSPGFPRDLMSFVLATMVSTGVTGTFVMEETSTDSESTTDGSDYDSA